MVRVSVLAGVIALAAVLFFARHRGSQAETKSSRTELVADRERAATRSAAPPTLAVAPVVKTDDVEHANVVGLLEPLEPGYLAVEHAAKNCYRGRPKPTPIRPNGPDETIESIQLEYHQVVNHGIGHVEALTISNGELTDQALQACIIKAAAAATWTSTAPDGELGTLQQNVNLGDLLRPDPGLPPVSQRSKPTAPPPPELAGPLGKAPEAAEDDHAGVTVRDPSLRK